MIHLPDLTGLRDKIQSFSPIFGIYHIKKLKKRAFLKNYNGFGIMWELWRTNKNQKSAK